MYKISKEDAVIIRKEMENTADAKAYAKLQVIALRGEDFTNKEIANITGYNSNYVGELCKTFVLCGLEALKTDGRKGGNNRHMNENEAAKFLEEFEEAAVKGQVITAEKIGKAYDKAVGKEHKSLSGLYILFFAPPWMAQNNAEKTASRQSEYRGPSKPQKN